MVTLSRTAFLAWTSEIRLDTKLWFLNDISYDATSREDPARLSVTSTAVTFDEWLSRRRPQVETKFDSIYETTLINDASRCKKSLTEEIIVILTKPAS